MTDPEVMCKSSRIAMLWIQYLDYVAMSKQYIPGERTGNWGIHLDASKRKCKSNILSGIWCKKKV